MTQVLFEHTAWFVYIYGIYGNTGHKKEGREENAHVMEVCIAC